MPPTPFGMVCHDPNAPQSPGFSRKAALSEHTLLHRMTSAGSQSSVLQKPAACACFPYCTANNRIGCCQCRSGAPLWPKLTGSGGWRQEPARRRVQRRALIQSSVYPASTPWGPLQCATSRAGRDASQPCHTFGVDGACKCDGTARGCYVAIVMHWGQPLAGILSKHGRSALRSIRVL